MRLAGAMKEGAIQSWGAFRFSIQQERQGAAESSPCQWFQRMEHDRTDDVSLVKYESSLISSSYFDHTTAVRFFGAPGLFSISIAWTHLCANGLCLLEAVQLLRSNLPMYDVHMLWICSGKLGATSFKSSTLMHLGLN